ncbi:hypothetical protein ACFE04_008471 [Oxalis oulophora]
MPNKLQRSITDYFLRKKKPSSTTRSLSFPSGKSFIRYCKHPRTLSFAINGQRKDCHEKEEEVVVTNTNDILGGAFDDSATLSDIDRFLIENFRSLYITKEDKEKEEEEKQQQQSDNEKNKKKMVESKFQLTRPTAPLTFDESGPSSASSDSDDSLGFTNEEEVDKKAALPTDCISVLKPSSSPYDDFRRSMQEIVEAKLRIHAKIDWETMEELLFCYLGMNDKKSYKFILSAFIDTMIVLREHSGHSRSKSRNLQLARERRRRILRLIT